MATMNKKTLFIFAVFLFLAAGVGVVSLQKVAPPSSVTVPVKSAPQPKSAASPLGYPQFSKQNVKQQIQLPSKENILAKYAAVEAMFNQRIDFYGKVIDETGKPIVSATTSFIISSLNLKGEPTRIGPSSDTDGRFSITAHSPNIIVRVGHPGYYKTKTAEQSFDYTDPTENSSSSPPTLSNPAIFQLRSKGPAEALIHFGPAKTFLPMDGRPVAFDLDTGRFEAGKNSVVLILHSDGEKLARGVYHPFDWKLQIQVPGGGIQTRPDDLSFDAPSEGYQTDFMYSQDGSLPRGVWRESIKQDFFLKLPSGLYARVSVSMLSLKGGCKIETFLNPSGSRNLEYDSNPDAQEQ